MFETVKTNIEKGFDFFKEALKNFERGLKIVSRNFRRDWKKISKIIQKNLKKD